VAQVAPNIEYAFHALGLDERRRSYSPTIWEKAEGQEWPVVLKQTWFPGVHSDIGGSYANDDLANITLAWMVSQLDPLLDFDHSYIVTQNRLSIERDENKHQPVREWGLGKIHDSMTFFFKLGGKKIRTPMQYTQPNPKDLKPFAVEILQSLLHLHPSDSGLPLHNTNEHVHASVRIRMGRNGRGYGDGKSSSYDSEALQGWTMYGLEASPSQPTTQGDAGQMNNVGWKKKVKRQGQDGQTEEVTLEMPEDEIGALERKIMGLWPEISDNFESIRPGQHAASVRSNTFQIDEPTGEPQSNTGAEDELKRPHRVGTV